MANGLNNVVLIGNISTDLESKQTTSGASVCRFNLAVNRRFSSQNGQKVDFIPIVTYKHNADYITRYMRKGRSIGVRGQIQVSNYTDSSGQKKYHFEVLAEEIISIMTSEQSNNEPRVSTPNNGDIGYTPNAYGGDGQQSFEDLEDLSDSSLPF